VQEVPGSNPGGPTSSFVCSNLPISIIVGIAPGPLVYFAGVPPDQVEYTSRRVNIGENPAMTLGNFVLKNVSQGVLGTTVLEIRRTIFFLNNLSAGPT
jgi:hypothetical protein